MASDEGPEGAVGEVRPGDEVPEDVREAVYASVIAEVGGTGLGRTERGRDGQYYTRGISHGMQAEVDQRVKTRLALIRMQRRWLLAHLHQSAAVTAREAAREEVARLLTPGGAGDPGLPRRHAIAHAIRSELATCATPVSETVLARWVARAIDIVGHREPSPAEMVVELAFLVLDGEVTAHRVAATEPALFSLAARRWSPPKARHLSDLDEERGDPSTGDAGPSSSRAPDPASLPRLTPPVLAPVGDDAPPAIQALADELAAAGVTVGRLTDGRVGLFATERAAQAVEERAAVSGGLGRVLAADQEQAS